MSNYLRQKISRTLLMTVSILTVIFICSIPAFAKEKPTRTPPLKISHPFSSKFISQRVPLNMEPGKKYPVSLTFKNTGKVPWISPIFVLGSQNPAGNKIWAIKEVSLVRREQIKPGQSKTFTFLVTAPFKRDIYNFQWQMKTKPYGYFGERSENLKIKVNSPPAIEPPGDKSTFEHKPLQFEVAAQDKDNDTLTYSASNLPPGATFDNSTHAFNWNPQHGQKGTYPDVRFEASDGITTASTTVSMTVLKTVIFGTIYEKNQQGETVPLEGVNIDILDMFRTTIIASGITNETGHFDVFYETWQDGTYIIRASKPGYRTYYGAATLRGNSMMPFSVTLFRDEPPTGTVRINNDAAYTNTTLVTLSLEAIDPEGAGVDQMQFSNDNSNWSTPEAYATTKSWTLTEGDGEKTVFVKFKDAAGNWSEPYSDTIILDTLPPQIIGVTPMDGSIFYQGVNFLVFPQVDDPDISPLQYQFSVNGQIVQVWSEKSSYNLDGWTDLTFFLNKIKIEVRDTGGEDSEEVEIYVVRKPIGPPQ